jgi:hypothetical protein
MEDMTKKMQGITVEMHEIARKTQRETVSMRIITLVTLFFLPATFIAVCVGIHSQWFPLRQQQSFMNTSVVQWKSDVKTGETKQILEWLALRFFLYTVGPLTFSTFCAWYAVYWSVDREERRRSQNNYNIFEMKGV